VYLGAGKTCDPAFRSAFPVDGVTWATAFIGIGVGIEANRPESNTEVVDV
jgi:hypothetical protein